MPAYRFKRDVIAMQCSGFLSNAVMQISQLLHPLTFEFFIYLSFLPILVVFALLYVNILVLVSVAFILPVL